MNNAIYNELFTLLRCALHDKPYENIKFQREVIREAKRQTVDGLILGIKGLRLDELSDEERDKFITLLPVFVRKNKMMNDNVARLAKVFAEYDIRYAVMKGQTCARFYSNPLLRRPGDIDVYVAEHDFASASDLLKELGFVMTDRTMAHTTWVKDDLDIEVHWAVQKLQWIPAYKALQRITRIEVDSGKPVYAEIGGNQVEVLPPTLNMVLLTAHAFKHVVSGGLGLRQICDWAVVLNATKDEIDFEYLENYLKELHLDRMFRVLAYIASKYLGYEENDVRLNPSRKAFALKDEHLGEKLLNWVIEAANFGHDIPLGTGKMAQVRYYSLFLKNCIRYFSLSPTEMLAWPGMKLYRGITGKNHLRNYRR